MEALTAEIVGFRRCCLRITGYARSEHKSAGYLSILVRSDGSPPRFHVKHVRIRCVGKGPSSSPEQPGGPSYLDRLT